MRLPGVLDAISVRTPAPLAAGPMAVAAHRHSAVQELAAEGELILLPEGSSRANLSRNTVIFRDNKALHTPVDQGTRVLCAAVPLRRRAWRVTDAAGLCTEFREEWNGLMPDEGISTMEECLRKSACSATVAAPAPSTGASL